ncbi:MAG: TIGR04282 family arsenosugar biosynthesis glycosyltransferase [Acidobacteriota bacterium]
METLVLFTKPAVPGQVKTRLIGALTAEQAAELHQTFLDDMVERLGAEGAEFDTRIAWALAAEEPVPAGPWPGERQRGADLGERLFNSLSRAASHSRRVAAVGSDHPALARRDVETAFAALDAADVVLGPATDGGYYLVAVRAAALDRRLFEDIPWSTGGVFEATRARCRQLGLRLAALDCGSDVDTAEDLRRLAHALAAGTVECPRTEALLTSWGGWLPS